MSIYSYVNTYYCCSSQNLDQHNSTNPNLTKITLKSQLPLFVTFSRAKIQFQQESIFDWEFCMKAKYFLMQISQQVQIGHAISQISLMWPIITALSYECVSIKFLPPVLLFPFSSSRPYCLYVVDHLKNLGYEAGFDL